ncbi:type I secretion system permease/ATPase, partial [Vibrio rotiferianus]
MVSSVPSSIFKVVKNKLVVLIWSLMFFSFFINLLVLSIPLYMLQVYNRVISSYSTDTLVLLTIIVIFAMFTMALLDIARAKVSQSFGNWMEAKISVFMLRRSIQFQA